VTALAHVAGFPLEESVLALAPVATLAGGAALAALRERVRRSGRERRLRGRRR
jgi:hypothetical protein